MTLIEIGVLGRPHGVQGEQYLHPCTLSADELRAVKRFTWRGRDGETRTLQLVAARLAHDRMLVRFGGVHDRDRAAELTLGRLLVERDRLPDPGPGAAYNFQLVGLEVVTEEGRALGTVTDVWTTPAHPVLVVHAPGADPKGSEGEILVPAIEPFVRGVDLEARRVTVRLLRGMEPEAGGAGDREPGA
jgi:16S rRNA processing protein RimM